MRPTDHELNARDDAPFDDEARDDAPSRSQLRREALDVLRVAHALVAMSDAQLQRVPLTDDIREETQRARAVTQQIARKRQTQFLAKQLRKLDDADIDAIRAELEHDRAVARRDAGQLHQAERWRERLLAEGDDALTELVNTAPHADRQRLRTLVRQVGVERARDKPPHAYRELFRLLKELLAQR